MKRMLKLGGLSIVSLGLLSSCTTLSPQQQSYYTPQPQMQQPQPPQMDTRIVAEVTGLRDRVGRVERAMIRMDRRMQLIERNELSRMQQGAMNGTGTPPASGMFQPMAMPRNASPQHVVPQHGLPATKTPYGGFQPVSYKQQGVTSSLSAAPRSTVVAPAGNIHAHAKHTAMPSLADNNVQEKDHDVSIWTISYENGKIWPGRDQLSASREVIESLRSGSPVALFARGADPSSHHFRERVRAISKYLSKVTDADNVPIASMSAGHLGDDTIELLVTR